jgi:hypothetical protein
MKLWITLPYDTARGGAETPLDSTESTPEPEEPPSEDKPAMFGLPLTAHAQEELLMLNLHKLCRTTLTLIFFQTCLMWGYFKCAHYIMNNIK